jgi:hypothetical protein
VDARLPSRPLFLEPIDHVTRLIIDFNYFKKPWILFANSQRPICAFFRFGAFSRVST